MLGSAKEKEREKERGRKKGKEKEKEAKIFLTIAHYKNLFWSNEIIYSLRPNLSTANSI